MTLHERAEQMMLDLTRGHSLAAAMQRNRISPPELDELTRTGDYARRIAKRMFPNAGYQRSDR